MTWPRLPVPDVVDLHIYGGLVLALVGGWRVELGLAPGWTFVALGSVLTAFGVFRHRLTGGA